MNLRWILEKCDLVQLSSTFSPGSPGSPWRLAVAGVHPSRATQRSTPFILHIYASSSKDLRTQDAQSSRRCPLLYHAFVLQKRGRILGALSPRNG